MIPSIIIGIIITLAFSAFFSGMEIAFVSSNKMLAELQKEKNGLAQLALTIFYKRPNHFVSTMLVGNNIALVIYGIFMAQLLDTTIFAGLTDYEGLRVTADTIISTLIVLVTGEFLPKMLFKINPNSTMSFFAIPAYICYVILYPISHFITSLSRLLLRFVGVRIKKTAVEKEFSKVDLDYLLQSSLNNTSDSDNKNDDVKIFQNALDFSDTKIRDCIVPRTEIQAVNIDCSIDELKNKFIESGNSKIVVYKENLDHVIGYIHSSEMFRHQKEWRQYIRTLPVVPETMAAKKLMKIFMQEHKSLGVVVDEFGGTSGIVSLEDLVEEIFGDIEDEHDNSNYVAKEIGKDEYILSARLEITKVNELFNLDLPESDEYLTISGLILHEYQSFPKLNEIIQIGTYKFKIINTTSTKIVLVKLKVSD
ncbi:MAG: HlyC/CorC family transporter [Bacteroidaceae bacterium]|mgnify:FL=1|jgi:CBS domain containing-hemolysin-like protein|nr:HlyC/CorC family transporter [Bacteroidaceae bacterium]